jgi:hypothetical protein
MKKDKIVAQYLLQRGRSGGSTAKHELPLPPMLSDTRAAPLLSQIIQDAKESHEGHCRFKYPAKWISSIDAEKLPSYLDDKNIYHQFISDQEQPIIIFYVSKEVLDSRFSNICSAYQSQMPTQKKCCCIL